MAAKFDAAQTTPRDQGAPPQEPPADVQRPTWLPEKFKSPEDLAKAYSELEARLGQKAPEAPEAPAGDAPPAPEGKPALDWKALSQKIVDTGSLSDEDRAAVKAMGIPDDIIDTYVASQVQSMQSFAKALHDEAGGEAEYETIRAWAAQNLTDSEKAALQKLVETGLDGGKMAVQTMKSRWQAAVGRNPTNPVGGKPPGTSGIGYESVEQMKADMRDPRYSKDPAFRAQVERKVAASTAF